MKVLYLTSVMLISVSLFACGSNQKQVIVPHQANEPGTQKIDSMKVKISVGTNVFTVTLYNNVTASAFKTKLPMNINMSELNGNEKFFDLPASLPNNALNPGTVQTGDLLLYGSNTLVLFYKTFSTSYNYTRVGRIDNPAGLAAALGSGSVLVSFEAK